MATHIERAMRDCLVLAQSTATTTAKLWRSIETSKFSISYRKLAQFLELVDESIGGRVVTGNDARATQFRENGLQQTYKRRHTCVCETNVGKQSVCVFFLFFVFCFLFFFVFVFSRIYFGELLAQLDAPLRIQTSNFNKDLSKQMSDVSNFTLSPGRSCWFAKLRLEQRSCVHREQSMLCVFNKRSTTKTTHQQSKNFFFLKIPINNNFHTQAYVA